MLFIFEEKESIIVSYSEEIIKYVIKKFTNIIFLHFCENYVTKYISLIYSYFI